MNQYLVDTLSMFKITYLVDAESEEQAKEFMAHQFKQEPFEVDELTQQFLGDMIVGVREITTDEVEKIEREFYGITDE